MDCTLPNDVLSNLVQAPILLVTLTLTALICRKCETVPSARSRATFVCDVRRNLYSTVVGMTVLLLFAHLLHGCDVTNFLLLCIVDVCVGTSLDAIMLHTMIKSGFRVGCYMDDQDNIDRVRYVWQCFGTAMISASSRSVSAAIGAVMRPSANEWLDTTDAVRPYIFTLVPALYVVIRYTMLDNMNFTEYQAYETVEMPPSITTHQIGHDSSSEDDSEPPTQSASALAPVTTNPASVVAQETRAL